MTNTLKRIAVSALIAGGTFGATLAGAAAQAAPADAAVWVRGGWHATYGGWYPAPRPLPAWRSGWRPAPAWYPQPVAYYAAGPRWYDHVHGYWRNRFGYWAPGGGFVRVSAWF